MYKECYNLGADLKYHNLISERVSNISEFAVEGICLALHTTLRILLLLLPIPFLLNEIVQPSLI